MNAITLGTGSSLSKVIITSKMKKTFVECVAQGANIQGAMAAIGLTPRHYHLYKDIFQPLYDMAVDLFVEANKATLMQSLMKSCTGYQYEEKTESYVPNPDYDPSEPESPTNEKMKLVRLTKMEKHQAPNANVLQLFAINKFGYHAKPQEVNNKEEELTAYDIVQATYSGEIKMGEVNLGIKSDFYLNGGSRDSAEVDTVLDVDADGDVIKLKAGDYNTQKIPLAEINYDAPVVEQKPKGKKKKDPNVTSMLPDQETPFEIINMDNP